MKRRELIKSTWLLLLGGIFLKAEKLNAEAQYAKTPSDAEGPYYPVHRQEDEDNNLIQVAGQASPAKGNVLNLQGVVLNTQGQPQNGVTVEIWQTDSQGRYKHPDDYSPGQRDSNFQYWGKTVTPADGVYSFKTLLPAAYSFRPPHIHYKVWVEGKVRLTSQIYFKNHPEDKSRFGSRYKLQVTELKQAPNGEFNTFFQIVI